MIFSENRYPPRIKCGAGFFGIMLWFVPSTPQTLTNFGIGTLAITRAKHLGMEAPARTGSVDSAGGVGEGDEP